MRRIFFMLSILSVISGIAFADGVQILKPDSWVKSRNPENYQLPHSKEISEGSYLNFIDIQTNVRQQKEYLRYIWTLTNETGVQNNSSVSVRFDPSYQKLIFHHFNVVRNGETINVLKAEGFEVFREEEDVSRFIYNGTYTALFILKDIRVGDRLDYAYTIKGFNPVFNGRYYTEIYFQGQSSLGEIYFTVTMPEGRKLYYKDFNEMVSPQINETSDKSTVYEWHLKNSKGKATEDYMPNNLDIFMKVQVSEMNSWNEVVEWGLSLNKDINNLSPQLRSKIDEFRNSSSNDLAFIKKCIRFVQDEIRYLGIETGVYSHRPHHPNQVFSQRYGDCKDKSLLLCAMLREKNIEAYPVYVNSNARGETDKEITSPISFNHCVAMYRLNEITYWIDPTISLQRGKINTQYFPRYEKGLVLKHGQNDLIEIRKMESGNIVVREKIKLNEIDSDGTIEVESRYTGYEADKIRNQLQNTSHQSLEESYRNYYQEIYDSLEVAESIEIDDNENENILTIREHYQLKKPWKEDDSTKGLYFFELGSGIIKQNMIILPGKVRKFPISLFYLDDIEYSVEVETPEPWTLEEEYETIDNEYFNYKYVVKRLEKGFLLEYNFKVLKTEVPPSEAGMFNTSMEKIAESLGYSITWNKSIEGVGGGTINVTFTIIAIFFLIFYFLIARIIFRKSIYPTPEFTLNTIGGWMILPLLGLIFSVFKILYSMLFEVNFFSKELIDSLKSNPLHTDFNWDAYMLFAIGGNLFLLSLVILSLICFFKRRDITPRLMIAYFITNLFLVAIDLFITNKIGISVDSASEKELYRSIISAIIWIPYFTVSKRVKQTFVIPYKRANMGDELNKNESASPQVLNKTLIETGVLDKEQ